MSSPFPPLAGLAVPAALRAAEAGLRQAGREEARVRAEWLLCGLLGEPRLRLLTERGRLLTACEAAAYERGLLRLAAGEPLQYVTGFTDFLGHRLLCDRRALIPRPETEQLVQWVARDPLLASGGHPVVVDVGTGTGCIAIALAAAFPGAEVHALDRSPGALALAAQNAEACGVAGRLVFHEGNLLEGWPADSFDLVVSNPPYVARAEIARLAQEVRDHEPHLALDGGEDGRDLLRGLVAQAAAALRPGGRLYLEIGEDQGAFLREHLQAAGWGGVRVEKDMAGWDRLVQGSRP